MGVGDREMGRIRTNSNFWQNRRILNLNTAAGPLDYFLLLLGLRGWTAVCTLDLPVASAVVPRLPNWSAGHLA